MTETDKKPAVGRSASNDGLGWQPIETAPKDGTRVLIVNDDGVMDVSGYVEQWDEHSEFVRKVRDGDVFRTVRKDTGYWDTDKAYCPTHWRPLPESPNVKLTGCASSEGIT